MICPFYAQSLHLLRIGEWLLIPNEKSNQCGLITDAHSPCVMQLECRIPRWRDCQRNPVNNGSGPEPI